MISTLRFIATHPLTADRPLSALIRFANWQIRSRIASSVTVPWIEGSTLVARNGMTGATGNIYCGLHEFNDMAFVIHTLKPGDVFVDVGANIGSYTILASKVCRARSISFEPDPTAFADLQKNIEANAIEPLVNPIMSAIGGESCVARLSVGHDTTNRIVTAGNGPTQSVGMTALDSALKDEAPTLIKLDIEGYEPMALQGARETLEKPSLLAVLTEDNSAPVQDILEASGFERLYYDPFSRTLDDSPPQNKQTNSLYVRKPDQLDQRLRAAEPRKVLHHTL